MSTVEQSPLPTTLPGFLSGGGEMANLIFHKNWSHTSIGGFEQWPACLRVSLGTLLRSPFPMVLYWGAELMCFYNDAFKTSLGSRDKHPKILGMQAKEAWPELWHNLETIAREVMEQGKSHLYYDTLVPILRNEVLENVYWTFSHSPAVDEQGSIRGVLAICTETTQKVTKLQNIVGHVKAPIMIFKGENLVVAEANQATLDLWQAGPEVIGKPFLEVKPEFAHQPFIGLIRNVYRTGEPYMGFEAPALFKRADGREEVLYFNFEYSAYREANGTISGVMILATDVTAQVLEGQKLAIAENEMRMAIDAASMGYWNLDPASNTFSCNAKTRELFGLPPEEAVDLSLALNNIHEEDRQRVVTAIQAALRGENGGHYQTEYRIVHPQTGLVSYVKNIGQVYFHEQQQPFRFSGTTQDVTASKLMEATLRSNEAKYRGLFQNMDQGFCIIEVLFDAQGNGYDYRFLEYNERFTEHSGLSDAMGKTMRQLVPGIEDHWPRTYGRVVQTGVPHRFVQVSEVMQRWFDVYAYRAGSAESRQVAILFTDITQRKLSEAALLESQNFTQSIIAAAPSLTYIYDLELNRNVFASAQSAALLGYHPEEIQEMGEAFLPTVIHPEDWPAVGHNYQQLLHDREDQVYAIAYRMRHKAGHWVWLYDRSRVFKRDTAGRPAQLLGLATDITEQKLLEEQLANQFEELETVYRTAPVGLALIDEDLRFLRINERLAEINGITAADHIGRTIFDIVPDLAPQVEGILRQIFKDGKPLLHVELAGETKAQPGVRRVWDESWHPIRDKAGKVTAISVVVEEITERKRAEERLRISENKFQNLVRDSSAAIVVLSGPEMKVEIVNQAYSRLVGLLPSDLLGQPLFSVIPDAEAQYLPLLEGVRTTGEPLFLYDSPYSVVTNGNRIDGYLHVAYQPYRDAAGNILGVSALLQDVTESVKARKELEASEARFRSLIEEAPVATSLFVGRSLVIEMANKRMIDYWGKGDTVLGMPLAEAMPELQGQPFLQILDQVYTTGVTYEARGVACELVRNGERATYYFDFTYQPLRNTAGEVYAIMDMAVEVTGQVHARKRLEESEHRFRSLANDTPAFMFMADADTNIDFLNKPWLDFVGMSFEQAKNKAWIDITHPDDVPAMMEVYRNAVATHIPYQFELRQMGADDRYHNILWKGIPRKDATGSFVGMMGVGIDITDRKETEQRIQELVAQQEQTLALLESLLRNAPIGFAFFDRHHRYLRINDNLAAINGIAAASHLGKTVEELLPDIATTVGPILDKIVATGSSMLNLEVQGQTPKEPGVVRNWLTGFYPVFNDRTKEVDFVGTVVMEITDRIRAEKALRQSEEQLRVLSDFMPQMVWSTRADGYHDFYNQRWYEFTGLNYEQTKADGWSQLLHPDDYQRAVQVWQQALATGSLYEIEYRMRRHDGQYRWLLARAIPLRNEEGTIIRWMGTCTDIQDQKLMARQLEEKVRERTRELERSNEDLQQFAHIASHDLKEPVRKVQTFVNLIGSRYGQHLPEQVNTYLSRMDLASRRMKAMIDGILLYSSLDAAAMHPQPIVTDQMIADILEDLDVLIEEKRAVVLYENLLPISGTPALLNQLLYNLIANALKFSKPDLPPVIKIATNYADQQLLQSKNLPAHQSFICITVQDNGIGFIAEDADIIFCTFKRLHSKDSYEGTGLGLAICRKIVERHEGYIWAEGAEGEGACFNILLPNLRRDDAKQTQQQA